MIGVVFVLIGIAIYSYTKGPQKTKSKKKPEYIVEIYKEKDGKST